jgi:hypothetical protein
MYNYLQSHQQHILEIALALSVSLSHTHLQLKDLRNGSSTWTNLRSTIGAQATEIKSTLPLFHLYK